MDAPDTSGSESLVSQGVVEIGDRLLHQVREHYVSDAGDDVAVNQIAVPALGVAIPSAPVGSEPLSCYLSACYRLLLAKEQYHRKQEIATEKNGISSGK